MSTKKLKIKNKPPNSPLQNIANKKLNDSRQKIDVNFSWLDYNQSPIGGTFEDWHEKNILLDALNTIREFTNLSRNELKGEWGKKWVEYSRWPPKCNFNQPKHLQGLNVDELNWARIRFGWAKRIVGVLYETTFYIVFLDHEHNFWLTEDK
jgi:hypothetical protein